MLRGGRFHRGPPPGHGRQGQQAALEPRASRRRHRGEHRGFLHPEKENMKLATYSPLPSGALRPGLVTSANRVIDIPAALGAGESTATMLGIIRAGAPMLEKLRALEKSSAASAALADVKLHAPIPRPVKNAFCVR